MATKRMVTCSIHAYCKTMRCGASFSNYDARLRIVVVIHGYYKYCYTYVSSRCSAMFVCRYHKLYVSDRSTTDSREITKESRIMMRFSFRCFIKMLLIVWWKLICNGIYYTNFAHKLLSV